MQAKKTMATWQQRRYNRQEGRVIESELFLVPKIRWPIGEADKVSSLSFWGRGWEAQNHQGWASKDGQGSSSTFWLKFPTPERAGTSPHSLSEGDGKDHQHHWYPHPGKTALICQHPKQPHHSHLTPTLAYMYIYVCAHNHLQHVGQLHGHTASNSCPQHLNFSILYASIKVFKLIQVQVNPRLRSVLDKADKDSNHVPWIYYLAIEYQSKSHI